MESSDAAASIVGLLLLGVMVIVGLVLFAFWLWMLIHAITNNGLTGSEKIAWVLVIIFVQLIGAIIYFFVGRPKTGRPLSAGSP